MIGILDTLGCKLVVTLLVLLFVFFLSLVGEVPPLGVFLLFVGCATPLAGPFGPGGFFFPFCTRISPRGFIVGKDKTKEHKSPFLGL